MIAVHRLAMVISHIKPCVPAIFVFAVVLIMKGTFGQSSNMLENNGGHFRFGNIRWRRLSGNNVEFTLETSWRRDFGSTYWQGRGPDGLAITGRHTHLFASKGRKVRMNEHSNGFILHPEDSINESIHSTPFKYS